MLAFVPFKSIPFVNTAPSPILIVVVLSPLPESGSPQLLNFAVFTHFITRISIPIARVPAPATVTAVSGPPIIVPVLVILAPE